MGNYKLHITNYPLQIDKMKPDNVIVDKSKAFALEIIALYKKLRDTNREFVMSKQLGISKNSVRFASHPSE